MNLDFLAPGQVVLTSDQHVSHPLAHAYRVEQVLPFHEDKVRKVLRENQVGPVTIKPRGVEVNVDQLSKRLSGKSGVEKFLFLLRLDKKILAVITSSAGEENY